MHDVVITTASFTQGTPPVNVPFVSSSEGCDGTSGAPAELVPASLLCLKRQRAGNNSTEKAVPQLRVYSGA